MITLTKIAMVTPTKESIYAPSPIETPRTLTDTEFVAQYIDRPRTRIITITEAEFMVRYADNPHVVQVSFEPDGVSNPQPVTAYGFGFDCWWIVTGVDK